MELYYRCPELYDLETELARAKESLEWQPTSEVAQAALGVNLYRAGRYEEAIRYQSRASATFGDSSESLFFLAMEHWQLGRKAEARSYYDRAVRWMDEHNPNGPLLVPIREEASRILGIRQ